MVGSKAEHLSSKKNVVWLSPILREVSFLRNDVGGYHTCLSRRRTGFESLWCKVWQTLYGCYGLTPIRRIIWQSTKQICTHNKLKSLDHNRCFMISPLGALQPSISVFNCPCCVVHLLGVCCYLDQIAAVAEVVENS